MRTDEEIAAEIKQTISHLTALFNEAKASNIAINFKIAEVSMIDDGKPAGAEFRENVLIQKTL